MKRGGSISGVVSLVMIFCVLCMAVFASLTMVTAQREHTLAAVTADRAAAYYEADRMAVKTVAAIARGESPAGVSVSGDVASFSVPAGGDTLLMVEARRTEDGCRILQWKTVFSGQWETEDRIEVWSGE